MDKEPRSGTCKNAHTNSTNSPRHTGGKPSKTGSCTSTDQQQRRVTTGSLTPDEYQRACGVLQGLHQALTIPERVEGELTSLTGGEMREYAGFHDGDG